MTPPALSYQPADDHFYLPDDDLKNAVNVALLMQMPLLLTGEPGTGKTSLARSIAETLHLNKPTHFVKEHLRFVAKSDSQARDLFYTYDALRHFHASQNRKAPDTNIPALPYIRFNALGQAILLTYPPEEISKYLPNLKPSTPLPRQSVVLIDEIDKAPRDFPNDLLDELDNYHFTLPELDCTLEVSGEASHLRPIIIITSNSEKNLPDAFLRRCIYHHIEFPSDENAASDLLRNIIKKHEFKSEKIHDAAIKIQENSIKFFNKLRDNRYELEKKPSTAEFLNWLTTIAYRHSQQPQVNLRELASQSLSALVKNPNDLKTARNVLAHI